MSSDHLNALYNAHVAKLETRLKSDVALRHAVGGEFVAMGRLEHYLLRSRGLKDGHMVVDVGCGSGRLACQLAPFYEIRYIGCDVVPRLLDYARELCSRPDWEFVPTDGTTIPAGDNIADFVTFFSVFTHLPQEQIFRYFREARRVLKPGGLMIMSFLEFRVPLHWANFIASVDGTRDDDHLNQYVEREAIKAWADASGFEIRSLYGGDTEYIPLPDEVLFENGTRMRSVGSLGQSVAVLQKRTTQPEAQASPSSPVCAREGATPPPDPKNPALSNASLRARLSDASSAILGFSIGGSCPRRTLIRAIGPGLSAFGIADSLARPQLRICGDDRTLAVARDPWGGASEALEAIAAAGAFTLRPDSNDVVICLPLPPGNYAAVVESGRGDSGEVLVEVYVI
jgi:ubiquinone/menaquinone biosynthesis C-methylase UbiE